MPSSHCSSQRSVWANGKDEKLIKFKNSGLSINTFCFLTFGFPVKHIIIVVHLWPSYCSQLIDTIVVVGCVFLRSGFSRSLFFVGRLFICIFLSDFVPVFRVQFWLSVFFCAVSATGFLKQCWYNYLKLQVNLPELYTCYVAPARCLSVPAISGTIT